MSSEDKLAALENELLVVRNELESLRLGRVQRTTSFIRRLLSSSPKEIPTVLREAPQLLRKVEPPRLERLSSSSRNFNPALNPLPLLEFPNVNVALVAEKGGYVDTLFSQTCNAFPVTSELSKQLTSYGAVQVLAIEASVYDGSVHDASINETVKSGSKLVIFYNNDTEINLLPRPLTKDAVLLKNDVEASDFPGIFTDIYRLNQRTDVPYSGKLFIKTADDIVNIEHGKLSIIDSSLLGDLAKTANIAGIQTILEKIGGYCPVVIKGDKPEWFDVPVECFNNDTDLDEFIEKVSMPYQLDRYAIACGRFVTINLNSIKPAYRILRHIGAVDDNDLKSKRISIILSTKRAKHIEHALEQIERQTIQPADVVLMLHGITDKEYDGIKPVIKASALNIKLNRVSESVLFGDVLNMAVNQCSSDFIAKIDDDDYYFPHHLEDLLAAHLSSCADIVGKWNNWVYLKSEDTTVNWVPENANIYAKHLPGGAFLAKADLLRKARFGKVRRAIDSELYRRIIRRGATLYSTHRYNFVRVRTGDHTYTISDAAFKERSDGIELNGMPVDIVSTSFDMSR